MDRVRAYPSRKDIFLVSTDSNIWPIQKKNGMLIMPDNDPAGDNSALKFMYWNSIHWPCAVYNRFSEHLTGFVPLFLATVRGVRGSPSLSRDLGTLGEPWEHLLQLLRLGYPHARVIVLDLEFPDDRVIELLFLGVIGFVTYESVERELPAAIRSVAQGSAWLDARALENFGRHKFELIKRRNGGVLTKTRDSGSGSTSKGTVQ